MGLPPIVGSGGGSMDGGNTNPSVILCDAPIDYTSFG